MIKSIFVAGALSVAATSAFGISLEEFDRKWEVESEGPYKLKLTGDTIELTASKGLSLWYRDKMTGSVTIEYDAQVVGESADDRLSDLNCFWMASDPMADDVFQNLEKRGGKFVNSYALKLYYMGYGGNGNTTTRFRRYEGDTRGISDPAFRPRIITEYTDPDHLLKPGEWHHIKITADGQRTQYFIDGELLVDFRDPAPLTEGWFAFRTTKSRTRLTNFRFSVEPPH